MVASVVSGVAQATEQSPGSLEQRILELSVASSDDLCHFLQRVRVAGHTVAAFLPSPAAFQSLHGSTKTCYTMDEQLGAVGPPPIHSDVIGALSQQWIPATIPLPPPSLVSSKPALQAVADVLQSVGQETGHWTELGITPRLSVALASSVWAGAVMFSWVQALLPLVVTTSNPLASLASAFRAAVADLPGGGPQVVLGGTLREIMTGFLNKLGSGDAVPARKNTPGVPDTPTSGVARLRAAYFAAGMNNEDWHACTSVHQRHVQADLIARGGHLSVGQKEQFLTALPDATLQEAQLLVSGTAGGQTHEWHGMGVSGSTGVLRADGKIVPAMLLSAGDVLMQPGRPAAQVSKVLHSIVQSEDIVLVGPAAYQASSRALELTVEAGKMAHLVVGTNYPSANNPWFEMEAKPAGSLSGKCLPVLPSPVDSKEATSEWLRREVTAAWKAENVNLPETSLSGDGLEELLVGICYYLGHWLGDGNATGTSIGTSKADLYGEDGEPGLMNWLERFAATTGAKGVLEYKFPPLNGIQERDYSFVRLEFTASSAISNTVGDPVWRLLCNLGCTQDGHKCCSPELIAKLMALPSKNQAALLAGGIASDGTVSKRGNYIFTQALLAHKGTASSKWQSHVSIVDAFSAVATVLGVTRGIWWERNYGNGQLCTTVQGPLAKPVRDVLLEVMPRKVPVVQRSRPHTVPGIRKMSAQSLAPGETRVLVVAIGEDGHPLDFVAGPGLWVLTDPRSRTVEELLLQSGWGPGALQFVKDTYGVQTKEIAEDTKRLMKNAWEAGRKRRRHEEMLAGAAADDIAAAKATIKILDNVTGILPAKTCKSLMTQVEKLIALGRSLRKDDAGIWIDANVEAAAFIQTLGHGASLTEGSDGSKPRQKAGLPEFTAPVQEWIDRLAAAKGMGPVRAAAALLAALKTQGANDQEVEKVREASNRYLSWPTKYFKESHRWHFADVPGRTAAMAEILRRFIEAKGELVVATQ